MNRNLRGAVYSHFRTLSEFAVTIGWSYSKAFRIVNGEQEPTANEITLIAATLGVEDQSEFMRIFFDEMSTKWTSGRSELFGGQKPA